MTIRVANNVLQLDYWAYFLALLYIFIGLRSCSIYVRLRKVPVTAHRGAGWAQGLPPNVVARTRCCVKPPTQVTLVFGLTKLFVFGIGLVALIRSFAFITLSVFIYQASGSLGIRIGPILPCRRGGVVDDTWRIRSRARSHGPSLGVHARTFARGRTRAGHPARGHRRHLHGPALLQVALRAGQFPEHDHDVDLHGALPRLR